jgi:hypothetical protein
MVGKLDGALNRSAWLAKKFSREIMPFQRIFKQCKNIAFLYSRF